MEYADERQFSCCKLHSAECWWARQGRKHRLLGTRLKRDQSSPEIVPFFSFLPLINHDMQPIHRRTTHPPGDLRPLRPRERQLSWNHFSVVTFWKTHPLRFAALFRKKSTLFFPLGDRHSRERVRRWDLVGPSDGAFPIWCLRLHFHAITMIVKMKRVSNWSDNKQKNQHLPPIKCNRPLAFMILT
jgi:hypothetical protein